MRTREARELLRINKNALLLAYVIGTRGQYSEEFNSYGLKLGEAFLGDFESYDMTGREYRTAKQQLARWGFATFRTTNKGTIGKLVDTRLFAIFKIEKDKQDDKQTPSKGQADDKPATTSEILRSGDQEIIKRGKRVPPPLFPRELESKIKGAREKIERLQGKPGREETIKALRENIRRWESALFEVDLPHTGGTNAKQNPRNAGIATNPDEQARKLKEAYDRREAAEQPNVVALPEPSREPKPFAGCNGEEWKQHVQKLRKEAGL